MRLKKETNKNEKKKFVKNKTLIEGTQNAKNKFENVNPQNKMKKINTNNTKDKFKEKNTKDQINNLHTNSKIYKPNKQIQTKQGNQNKKGVEKSNIYPNNNLPITMNTNNNINIGNNINIITNNSLGNNANTINDDTLLKNNLMSNSQILPDYNLNKKPINDLYENNTNTMDFYNYNRLSRMNYDIGNLNRKNKSKNTSVEQRHRRKLNKDVMLDDNNELSDNDKIGRLKNHIYPKPYKYKYKSPDINYNDTYKHQTFIDMRQDMFNDNLGEIYNNNINNKFPYNNNYIEENNLGNVGGKKMFYSNNYNKANHNSNYFNINKNNYNSLNDNNMVNINDFQNKTTNNFYVHKSPATTIRNINKMSQNYNNNYFNYINNKNSNTSANNNISNSPIGRHHINSMIMESNYQMPFDYKDNNFSDNNNVRNEGYKSSRRSKNKIRITKGDNPAIIEYNLDISDINEESDNYLSEFPARNEFNKNNRSNDYKFNTSLRNKKDLQQYYNYFTKDIRPSVNTQFNIYSASTHSKAVTPSNNTFISTISNINTKGNNLLNNETNSLTNNLISTPNFSEYGKTPKRPIDITDLNIKPFNNNEIIDNNNKIISKNININFDDDTSVNKILIKKRPKNEIPKPSLLNKRKNSSSSLNSKNSNSKLNTNINKSIYEICHNENINFEPIENQKEEDENKLVFNNDNEVVEYINKKYDDEKRKKNYFNKKLRFTGFVLCKKYKGKNLYDIRIEDDIEKINNQFKEEQVVVSDKKVELKFVEEKSDLGDNEEKKTESIIDNNIKAEFEEEIKKLKSENEKLNKKDAVKNDLITKLDKEKQKLLEEIEKLTNSIEKLKNTNNKLIEEKNERDKAKEEEKNNSKIDSNKKNIFTIEYNSLTIIDNINSNKTNNNSIKENTSIKVNEDNIIMNDDINIIDNLNINDINHNMDDDNKDENKENDNNHNDSYDNKHNTSLNNNQILSDIINGENIDEKINDINIENYCNNNNYSMDNNLNELNNNKNDFMDIMGNDQIIKIDEINNHINFEDNKDLCNIINESSNNEMDINNINNRSHPRINELVESEISERDEFK